MKPPKQNWHRPFDLPIELPEGKTLSTLLEAANYITGLSPKLQKRENWQYAAEALMKAADNPVWMKIARMSVVKAVIED